jgi:hypothetical protein
MRENTNLHELTRIFTNDILIAQRAQRGHWPQPNEFSRGFHGQHG